MSLIIRQVRFLDCSQDDIPSLEEFAIALKEYFPNKIHESGVVKPWQDRRGTVYIELYDYDSFEQQVSPLVRWLYDTIASHSLPAPRPC